MRRVLMVSPHFPPDNSAAAHRVRLLAPHLSKHGWAPTVVTVDPRDYECRLDHELGSLVPPDLRIIRCRAWPARWTRRIGIGDLGLRAFKGLLDTCSTLLSREAFHVVFITMYPTYPAFLGSILKRKFGIPFVLDYQDPWVGAWGATVGSGRNGRPEVKSRVSRALAVRLEPRALRRVDGVTAVSRAIYEQLLARYPRLHGTPCAEIPVGGEPADFERLREHSRPNPYFDSRDGDVHLCHVGTLPPLGLETLRTALSAVVEVRQRRPDLYRRLRLHFFGGSGQNAADPPKRVTAVARELGIADCLTEIAPRLGYLDALTIQIQATAILMLGSSEPHYTASRLYPALLARRPIFALYHEASSVVEILRRAARAPAARVVTYDGVNRAESRVNTIYAEMVALIESPVYEDATIATEVVHEFSAESLAGRLAAVLDQAETARGR